jgi:hypothetical protein
MPLDRRLQGVAVNVASMDVGGYVTGSGSVLMEIDTATSLPMLHIVSFTSDARPATSTQLSMTREDAVELAHWIMERVRHYDERNTA